MGQSNLPNTTEPNSGTTSGNAGGRSRARSSLRTALNALMMSDERKRDGKPGEITLEMEKDPHSLSRSQSRKKSDRSERTQDREGVRNMSMTANNEINHSGNSEPIRIGRRGGHGSKDAPITIQAEPINDGSDASAKKTQMVRGEQSIKRSGFHQEPVVGWLVVIGGPGLGAYRPVFEGNNTLGRSESQRIPINFGDESISGEEQVYIRYDSSDKNFLLVPNLTKTNVVAVNDEKPTSAVPLNSMDVITVGRTQLVFVPFCGVEFDWSELKKIQK